jgi:hypothetical protein
MPRVALLLLCSALMMSGCAAVSDVPRSIAAKQPPPTAQLPKKASLTSSPSSTPTKRAPAPEKLASGLGGPLTLPEPPDCPQVSPAVYEAAEKPAALPPAGYVWKPDQTRRWVEALEGQVDSLKDHLRDTADALARCHRALGGKP